MAVNGYSDDELMLMMADPESDLVERKRLMSSSVVEKISRNICAFANDLSGRGRAGVVVIGVEDDGRCAGAVIDDELLSRLAALRDGGRLMPLPSMDVQRRDIGGCIVAVVTVHPSPHPPVRYRGRVWVRVGPTVRCASAADEQRLAERRRAADLPFDLRPAEGANLDDISLGYVRDQYLRRAVAADVLAENRRSLQEQLRSLRLVSGDCPTWGALLAFAHDPQWWLPGAYVQFVRFDGDDITDPVRTSTQITGRIEDVLNSVSRVLELGVEIRSDVASGRCERRVPDYPVEALRQIAYNAVMHRSYESANTPVRIYWYSDRVVIESPGGPFGAVTAETIREGATGYRNALVAEIMHNLGFAQRFGLGIPLARRALRGNGNPEPEFDVHDWRVRVTVRSAR